MINFDVELKLREVYRELSNEFNFSSCYLEIIISSRLRSSNGRFRYRINEVTKELERAEITMSRALLDEFGWEVFERTFRHEVAHIANILLYHQRGHSDSFKNLCQQFGGKMNRQMAGIKYADCASRDYVKLLIKWIYKCPCGYEKKMAKRMNKRKRGSWYYKCGYCKITLNNWKEIRVV